jgi:hypothetical protein
MRIQPIFELFSCNMVPPKCLERMHTLSNVVLLMPTSIDPASFVNHGRGEFNNTTSTGRDQDRDHHQQEEEEEEERDIMKHVHFVPHILCTFVAFVQRYGMLGTVRLSPVTFMIWKTFAAQWRGCASICIPQRVQGGQNKRCEQMIESRAVAMSLHATVLAELAKPSDKKTYIDHTVAIARSFANNAIDPACTPYMIAALIDQTLRMVCMCSFLP